MRSFPETHHKGRRRVIHLITRMIIGGAEWNTFYTVTLLNPRRYEPFVACGPQTGSEGSLIERTKEAGIPIFVIPDLVREIHPFRDLKALSQLIRLFRSLKVQILHTHTSKAGILGRLAGRLAKVPVVIHTVHGFAFLAPIPDWKRRLYLWLERKAGRWCDALIFISPYLMEEAKRWGIGDPRHYYYIPSGIDLKAFRKAPQWRHISSDGCPVIGTVARIVKEKGFQTLLHAADRLKRKGLSFRLVWVGDGPDRSRMEALAQQLGLQDRLTITGMCYEVPEWLSRFDIFVLPTFWEGMGRVFLEAQAAGVPVVGTKVGGVPDVVLDGESGILVPVDDPDALAEALERLVLSLDLRQRMGQAGRAFVGEHFSAQRMVTAIEEVYEKVWGACQSH